MTTRFALFLTTLALAGGTACSGSIDDPAGGTGNPGPPAPPPGPGPGPQPNPGQQTACLPSASLAPARLWRLTDEQYVNVVAQVFGVQVPPEVTEPATHPGEFSNLSELLTAESRTVAAYETAARSAARTAVAANLNVFLPCGVTAPPDACVEQFIRNRIGRAFGRRLEPGEVQDLMALYKLGQPDGAATGIAMVIEAALQAPSFLYRQELGTGATTGTKKLSAHEVASAISFALLDSVPDEPLWDRAQDGSLLKPPVLAAEVDRLLALPAVQRNLSHKAGFWLGVERLHETEKDVGKFPEFTAALRDNLYESARLFVEDVFTRGKVSDLLSSRRLYANAALARVYGIPGVTGDAMVPVDVTLPERSSGILSQPALLAAFSRPDRGDPIHRGLFIYNSLVCGSTIPPPPAGALEKAATFPKDASERELSRLRTSDPVCGACHGLFDPLGLSTERYDPIGRYHAADAAGPIDSSATIANLGADLDGPVSGLPDLVARLKVGRRVTDCAAQNLAVFVLGRTVTEDNSCTLRAVKDSFATSGSFVDYYRALLTSPAFVARDAAP